MDSTPEPVENGPTSQRSSWERTVFWMFVLALFTGAGLYVFQSCRNLPRDTLGATVDRTVQVMTNVTRSLAELASRFNQGIITTSLTSTRTSVENTKYLQFKTIRQVEIFSHSDQAFTAFGYVPLPEILVEARAPVEYTYYLDLNDLWQIVVQDGVVHVFTPRIRFNKPAVDVSKIEYEVKRGSLLRDATEAREDLKRSLTSLAVLKARENVQLVRETGRDTVAEFVQQWMRGNFADGTNYQVKVYFPGEKEPETLASENTLLP